MVTLNNRVFRNKLIDEYFGVRLETVWCALEDKLPILELQTEEIHGMDS